jgi:tRNA(fMet)-specific endonuclease VapC
VSRRVEILPFDPVPAAHSGQPRAALKARRRPIIPNDVMIAGHARSAGRALFTNNNGRSIVFRG